MKFGSIVWSSNDAFDINQIEIYILPYIFKLVIVYLALIIDVNIVDDYYYNNFVISNV